MNLWCSICSLLRTKASARKNTFYPTCINIAAGVDKWNAVARLTRFLVRPAIDTWCASVNCRHPLTLREHFAPLHDTPGGIFSFGCSSTSSSHKEHWNGVEIVFFSLCVHFLSFFRKYSMTAGEYQFAVMAIGARFFFIQFFTQSISNEISNMNEHNMRRLTKSFRE